MELAGSSVWSYLLEPILRGSCVWSLVCVCAPQPEDRKMIQFFCELGRRRNARGKKRGFFNKVLLFIEGNRRADVKVHVFHELKSRFFHPPTEFLSLLWWRRGASRWRGCGLSSAAGGFPCSSSVGGSGVRGEGLRRGRVEWNAKANLQHCYVHVRRWSLAAPSHCSRAASDGHQVYIHSSSIHPSVFHHCLTWDTGYWCSSQTDQRTCTLSQMHLMRTSLDWWPTLTQRQRADNKHEDLCYNQAHNLLTARPKCWLHYATVTNKVSSSLNGIRHGFLRI